jgi:hypothetical protein
MESSLTHREVKSAYQADKYESRLDINSKAYKDTLEQYVEQQSNPQGEKSVRASMPSMKSNPQNNNQLELKGNMANFYGAGDESTPNRYLLMTQESTLSKYEHKRGNQKCSI